MGNELYYLIDEEILRLQQPNKIDLDKSDTTGLGQMRRQLTVAIFHFLPTSQDLEDLREHCKELIGKKSQEYNPDNKSNIHNFIEASKIANCRPREACYMFALKHIVSIRDMRSDIKYDKEYILEKFGDLLNYICLIQLCLKHEKEYYAN